MAKGIIEKEWDDYSKQVLPAACSAIQRQEMKRAFYAGCATLLASMSNIMDEDEEPTAQDLVKMESIAMELDAFNKAVGEGRA